MLLEITTTNTTDNVVDLSSDPILKDFSNDALITAFIKISDGTFYFAVGETSVGKTFAFTSAETVVPIQCTKENPLHYRSAATGADAVISFCVG